MSISGPDLQLLNNICENGTYLEDNDDIQQQAGDILRDVSNWSEIEPEVQEKLFIACRQYLEISIEKQEILYDELEEKENIIRTVEQASKTSIDYGMNQGAHMIKQLEEQLDQERQDHEREKNEFIAKIENDQREFESQLRDRDRSYDSLCKELETLRMNQLKVGNDAANTDELTRKLNEKRELLSEQIDANQKLEEVIRQLEEQNKTLRDDMEEATKQMIAMDTKYTKMEERYESDDVEHESLSNERDRLKSEVENLQQALIEREQESEQIRVEVVQRTNQLVAAAHEKDLEIARQSKQLDELDRQLRNAELAPEKRRLHEQDDELKQRALKISILEEKLNQSLNDVIELNEVIAKFNQQQTPSAELHHLTRRYESVVKEHESLKEDHAELEQRVHEQELTLRDVEDKLSKEVHIRSNLEAGVTGLPEARAQNMKLETALMKRTKERDRLTMGIGEIDDKLTEMIDENDLLRAQVEREQRDLADISRLREQLNIRNQTMRSENETLRAKVEVLEEERIELKVRARRAIMNSIPENVSTASLTQAQLDQVIDLIDILRSGQQPIQVRASEESHIQNKAIEDLTYGVHSELKALRGELQSFTDARTLTSSVQLPVQASQSETISGDATQFSELNRQLILLQNELESERRKYTELEANVKPQANEPLDLITRSSAEAERRENVALQSTISDLLEKIKTLEERETELQRDHEEKTLTWSKSEEEYETKCSKLSADVDNLTTELQQCSVNLEEFTRLKNSLEGSADQKETQIADCIANLTNVRIELVRQKRAVRLAEHEVSSFKRKLTRNQDILAALRKKNLKRVESVDNFRNNYKLQVSRLRQELSSSVPRYQFEKTQLELEKKCLHIRKSAEMATNEVVAEIELSHLQDKFLKLQIEKDHVLKELTIAKEKLVLLSPRENDENAPPVETIRSKFAALEIKELDARQKCAHLEARNTELEQVKATLIARITDLEKSLESLSTRVISQADKEGELRTQLSKSIPIDVAEKTKSLLQKTVEENVSLNSETEKLRNLLALEESQTTQLRKELAQATKSVEMFEKKLKNTELLDSDSEATFLLLNKEINNLQAEVIESNNFKNQEAKKADKLEERVLILEKDVNQRDILLSILIRESFQRTTVLEASVNEFKSSFAGAIPVESLERYQKQVSKIKEQKNELERHREALLREKGDLESARVEYEVKLAGLNELMAQIKTNSSREKEIVHVQEWHQKIELAKMSEQKAKRAATEAKTLNKALKTQIDSHLCTIDELENDFLTRQNVHSNFAAMASRHESVMIEIRELMDDHHKRKVETLKSTTDAELPDNLAERSSILERNVLALKSHVSELTADSKRLREEASAAWAKVVDKESKILNLEQSLSKARHMLGEQDRKSGDVIIQSLQRDQQNVSGAIDDSSVMVKLMMLEKKAAQANAVIETQEQELNAKNDTIQRLEQRLKDARRELRNLELQHDEQLSELRQRLSADVSERALHLTRTQQSLTASAVNAAAEEQMEKLRQQLDKKTKKMEKLMDTVRKQLEIKRILENKLQKAFAQARDAQGSAEALEKDYETQVKLLKETIQARNDEIASMNSPRVPPPSSMSRSRRVVSARSNR